MSIMLIATADMLLHDAHLSPIHWDASLLDTSLLDEECLLITNVSCQHLHVGAQSEACLTVLDGAV